MPFNVSVSCCCVTSYPRSQSSLGKAVCPCIHSLRLHLHTPTQTRLLGERGISASACSTSQLWLLAMGELWSLYVSYVVIRVKVQWYLWETTSNCGSNNSRFQDQSCKQIYVLHSMNSSFDETNYIDKNKFQGWRSPPSHDVARTRFLIYNLI